MSLIERIDADTKAWILNAADERAVRLGCRMDLERAAFAIDWVSNNCRLYEGEKAGELIELMDWQKSAMVRMFGWVVWSKHFNRWVRRFRKARVWTGKKNGKALSVDTPIPMPGGWKAMGDVEVGDCVLGPDGRPTNVVGAFQITYGNDCYRVEFSDGHSIVCDIEHLWEVLDRSTMIVRVMTTQEILDSEPIEGKYRFSVPAPFSKSPSFYPVDIVAVYRVPSVPVRCIAVDNPRKLYLAGPGMVATHNTPYLAALELYLAFGDGEQGQKVYTAASNGDQARISQLQAVMMVKQMPNWQDEFKIYENTYEIRQASTNSKMMVLTSGTEKNKQAKEGLNGSVCWDELHVVPQTLVNRVSRAGISRAEPLDLAVSTAGLDRNCYGFQEFEYGRKVNSGAMEERDQDWRYFHVDYAIPDTVTDEQFDADPRKYGAMCNPSWGKIIDPDEFENDYRMSKRNTAERRLFMVYRCTKWVDSVTRWIEEGAWRRAGENYTWKDLKGRECYAGLDLSQTKDMTALVLCFPFEESGKQVYKLWPFFWLPETRIEQLAMNYPFKQWVNDGHLRATPEGRVCYTLLKSQIRAIAKEVDFRGLFYDPYKAEDFTQSLCEGEQDPETGRMLFQPIGCDRTMMKQGIGHFHEPTATFEHHLLGAEVRHPNHPILTWQASHVEVVTDINKNMKPVKPKDQEYTGKSVDGIVAAIMALAGAVRSVDSQPRVWRIGQ